MQTTGATVTSWGEAVMTSMVAALAVFLATIPRVIGFLRDSDHRLGYCRPYRERGGRAAPHGKVQ